MAGAAIFFAVLGFWLPTRPPFHMGNHGLWLAFEVFMVARAALLARVYTTAVVDRVSAGAAHGATGGAGNGTTPAALADVPMHKHAKKACSTTGSTAEAESAETAWI
jgi:hypothetical protein